MLVALVGSVWNTKGQGCSIEVNREGPSEVSGPGHFERCERPVNRKKRRFILNGDPIIS